MNVTAESIRSNALDLPTEELRELILSLIESGGEPLISEIGNALESARRIAAMERGDAKLIPADEVIGEQLG